MALRAEPGAATLGKWLLAIVVPASALFLGSLPAVVLSAVSVFAALACVLLWLAPLGRMSRASRAVLCAMALLLGMTLLQSVPLPAGLVRILAPASASIWERALAPLHEAGPSWHTLSIAPVATRVEVLKGLFYVCVFLAAARVVGLEHGERFLTRVVLVATSLMAFSALAHSAVSAETVFGIYHPRDINAYAAGRLSPLLNTNHLAAYLSMGACVALACFLARRSVPRALSGSLTLVLAATSLWQGSRGATGSLCFGLVLTFVLSFYARRRFQNARVEMAIVAACAVAATIVVTIAMSDASAHLQDRDLGKVDVARRSLALVADSPWFGFGRGGFESVFPFVRQSNNYMTWTNPENLVVQWLVDWGLPVTVLGLALIAWAFRPHVVLSAIRPMIGPWVALVVGGLHELVDFHFEVPGIVALAAVCAALVVSGRGGTRDRTHGQERQGLFGMRLVSWGLGSGVAVAIAVLLPDMSHGLAEERRALSAMVSQQGVSREQFQGQLRAAMLRYPAEPFLPLMGAVRAQRHQEGSVVPWIGRALERNPRFGRAHFVLARSLAPRHAAQARLEYRLAYQYDEALRGPIAAEAVSIVDGFDAALELVPSEPEYEEAAALMRETLVTSLADVLPSTAVMLDAEIERHTPLSISPLRRRAKAAASDALTNAPWCPNDGCVEGALSAARELVRREPTKCDGHLLVAKLEFLKRPSAEPLDVLERAMVDVSDRAACQRQFIELAFSTGRTVRGDAALERLVRGGCGAEAECLDLYAWAASTEEGRGRYPRAVQLYRRILDLTPERDDLLEQIGRLGEHDGLLSEGLAAYATLATRHPGDPRWPTRIAELRARARPVPSLEAP